MRSAHRYFAMAFAAGFVLLVAACAGNGLDNGDSPNVILSISQFPPIPPVTTQYSVELQACVFTAPPAVNVTLKNDPKSELAATGPFSNVVIDSAIVTWLWDDGITVGPKVQSTSGLIPANATATVPVTPIFLVDLTPDRAGHSANMQLIFHGRLLDGKEIQSLPYSPGGGVLSVNSCLASGTAICGDGLIRPPEQCDQGNGNVTPGDGCDASCQIEQGWSCAGEPSVCQQINLP